MSNQLLLGLQTAWINRAIAEGNVEDRANEDEVEYSFLSDARNEFHRHGQDLTVHLFSDRHTRGLFVEGTDGDRSIVWNQNALALWAKAADRMHTLLFLLMHFTVGGPHRGEEYRSYLLRNTEHSDRTFYWSGGTIMTFQRYHKGTNAGWPVKLIPRFLPSKLNSLFIKYILLVRPVQSFIAGLRENNDAARQYMNLWAVQRDAAMDGEDVSRLVATAFLEHANLDLGFTDYRHLVAYFGGAIKQSYCTEFPIDEMSGHSSTMTARQFDLLVVMPTGHDKSAVFMISPMVTARTVIVVVPLTILVRGHEADATRAGLQHATYGADTIAFDDPPSIVFVSVERAATPRFVELAHTLNHFRKLHCMVVDEAHLLLSNFRPVMKRLLPLWAVGCQLVALTASLSPFEETNLKIVMFARFAVVWMSTVCPLIQYVVDEVADVDEEIVRQFASTFIAHLSDLLLLCTEGLVGSLVTAGRVSAE
ncbi:unnamed protein product [Sphagnum troendelagicum]